MIAKTLLVIAMKSIHSLPNSSTSDLPPDAAKCYSLDTPFLRV